MKIILVQHQDSSSQVFSLLCPSSCCNAHAAERTHGGDDHIFFRVIACFLDRDSASSMSWEFCLPIKEQKLSLCHMPACCLLYKHLSFGDCASPKEIWEKTGGLEDELTIMH